MDLPEQWPGYAVLLNGDLDQDMVIEENELDDIDWISFSEAVGDFQKRTGIIPEDSKLGPHTLGKLKEIYKVPAAEFVKRVGDLDFRPSETPTRQPPGPPLIGNTVEERRICNLWNRYGAAIHEHASVFDIQIHAALAVFSVESGQAYDPATGLLIIRFEPHIFKRKGGAEISWDRGGQKNEWINFENAYQVNPEAALVSCSYGLPQLMGFNYTVTVHETPKDMVLAFQRSCVEQVAGFFGFVEKNDLVAFIRDEDWRTFTRHYNGPGNVDVYSGRLTRAVKVIESLKQDGAKFEC